jgi:hypothetical protein
MASEPLPDLPPVDPKFLAQCLRMMLAVLPRQNADDIAGELFVAAYKAHLGTYPKSAVEYLAHRATGECRWFPTIAECKEIIAGWRRDDEGAHRRGLARQIAWKEREARRPKAKPEVPWTPEPGELERIKQEVADRLRATEAGR